MAELGETCDGTELHSRTCQTEGFLYGVLACTGGCALNTSGCSNSRYTDNGDGTITDHPTKLMWEKKVNLDGSLDGANLQDADNYYRWACYDAGDYCQPDAASSATCTAGVQGNSYGCAVCGGACIDTTIWAWANQLNAGAGFAGHKDWRVPTRLELDGLLDWSTYSPMVDVAFNGASCGASCTNLNDPACSCTQSGYHWSATTGPNYTYDAYYVYFSYGYVDWFSKNLNNYVRAVRPGS